MAFRSRRTLTRILGLILIGAGSCSWFYFDRFSSALFVGCMFVLQSFLIKQPPDRQGTATDPE
ncbi:MAG: hypothetical protein ACI8UD_003049 [Planctomycetota bacterium]|jgi:hypothetical protein